MGRNSGGVRGGSGTGSNNSGKGKTEDGYTAKMVKNILGMENRIRRNRDESLHVFDSKGNLIKSIGGNGAQVNYEGHKIPQNSILTHNHPKALGARGIRRIGNSFSIHDIASAINLNAKEIRAVTPTYTFSLKRPKGGWGVSAKEAAYSFNAANNKVKEQGYGYLKKRWNDMALARAEITHFHKVMKIVSKKYGWIYSKKNR